MPKFFGKVGYGSETVEDPPESGVWKDVVIEKDYYGDILRNTRQLDTGEKVNNDISVSNSISIVSDPYAEQNFFAIKYIWWMGKPWIVSDVEIKTPRLVLKLGGLYNGPTA